MQLDPAHALAFDRGRHGGDEAPGGVERTVGTTDQAEPPEREHVRHDRHHHRQRDEHHQPQRDEHCHTEIDETAQPRPGEVRAALEKPRLVDDAEPDARTGRHERETRERVRREADPPGPKPGQFLLRGRLGDRLLGLLGARRRVRRCRIRGGAPQQVPAELFGLRGGDRVDRERRLLTPDAGADDHLAEAEDALQRAGGDVDTADAVAPGGGGDAAHQAVPEFELIVGDAPPGGEPRQEAHKHAEREAGDDEEHRSGAAAHEEDADQGGDQGGQCLDHAGTDPPRRQAVPVLLVRSRHRCPPPRSR
ncbi:hypothetical protein MTP03_14280 [Tsukamurella sp. PLM1]|nr:hypothetical protein MTP03_14280 [Tsukamurella sp. PLM1]